MPTWRILVCAMGPEWVPVYDGSVVLNDLVTEHEGPHGVTGAAAARGGESLKRRWAGQAQAFKIRSAADLNGGSPGRL